MSLILSEAPHTCSSKMNFYRTEYGVITDLRMIRTSGRNGNRTMHLC